MQNSAAVAWVYRPWSADSLPIATAFLRARWVRLPFFGRLLSWRDTSYSGLGYGPPSRCCNPLATSRTGCVTWCPAGGKFHHAAFLAFAYAIDRDTILFITSREITAFGVSSNRH